MLQSGALYDMKKGEVVKESGFTPSKEQAESGRYWLDEDEKGHRTWWYLDRGFDLTDPGHLLVGGFMRNPEDFWRDEGGEELLAQEWHHMDPYATGLAQAPNSYTPLMQHDPLTRKGTIDEETVKESVLWWYDKLRASGVSAEQLEKTRADMKGKWNSSMGQEWWEILRQRMIRFYHKHYWLPQVKGK